MEWKLHGTFRQYEIKKGHLLRRRDATKHFSDMHSAIHFLSRLGQDPFAMASLHRLATENGGSYIPAKDQQVFEGLARQLTTG